MTNLVRSPRLESMRMKRAQNKNEFTLKESATYWCGYLETHRKDPEASAEYRQVFDQLIAAAKDGTLKLLDKVIESQGGGVTWVMREPIPVKHYTNWQECKVTREALREFAESIGETPEFLFPDIKHCVSSSQSEWPWGEHDTVLLQKLKGAAFEFWSLYDPEDPSTAPTNEQVYTWLKEEGVSVRVAEVIAQILRADGLPSGPRKS